MTSSRIARMKKFLTTRPAIRKRKEAPPDQEPDLAAPETALFASFKEAQYRIVIPVSHRSPLLEELAGPGDEMLHVRAILVAAVVLAPGEFAVEQAGVDRRHLRGAVVFLL